MNTENVGSRWELLLLLSISPIAGLGAKSSVVARNVSEATDHARQQTRQQLQHVIQSTTSHLLRIKTLLISTLTLSLTSQ